MARSYRQETEDDSIVLTYEEAYQRAWEAAERLEDLMGQYTDEPYVRDDARIASLASDCLAFLSDHVVITSPCDED